MKCMHFPACGGCKTQDVPYLLQLQEKQVLIESLFPTNLVSPIIPCQSSWHYRNKMEFTFSQNRAGDRFLGLILKKSRGKVFNLQECFIAPEGFANTLSRVRTWWEKSSLLAFHFRSAKGTLRTLTLRQSFRTGEKMAILTVSGNPEFALKQFQIDQFVKALDDPKMSIFLQIHQAIPGKPTQFFEMHLAGPTHIIEHLSLQNRRFQFKISPTSFFQPNTEQAEVLYNTALSLPLLSPNSCVYDLYCGTGTFGILCAPAVKQVVGIELNPHAVFDGQMNAEINNISNISFYKGDIAHVLTKQSLPSPDLVILDPPRAGLDPSALQILHKLNPPQILYVSCNPVTQAQNIQALPNYHLSHIQPIDQFPHTPHIENICLLKNKLS